MANGFAQTPDSVLFDRELPASAKVVYAVLNKYSTLPKGAIPSHATLASKLGMSVSAVRRSIAELKTRGYVKSEPRAGTSSRYTLFTGEHGSVLTGEQGVCSPVNRGSVHGRTTIENELNKKKRVRRFPIDGQDGDPAEDFPFY